MLDIGCGTGLSGAALAAAGFTAVDGADVNAEMLSRAREAGVYRATHVTDLSDPFPFPPGTYGAMAAIGVIGVGAAPASLLGEALDALTPGGHLVFSYNDHALAVPDFREALESALATGRAEEVFREHGPHFEALGSGSSVYVLRRLAETS